MSIRVKTHGFLLAAATMGALGAQTAGVSFERDVKPVLEARCLKCHGAKLQLGKLDLRTRESAVAGGAHGPAFVAGNAEASRLYRHVAGLEKPPMPMDGRLRASEVEVLRGWLAQGAPWSGTLAEAAQRKEPEPEDRTIAPEARQWWSFRPLRSGEPPRNGNSQWDAHPVDAFVFAKWREQRLTHAPEADREPWRGVRIWI